MTSQHLIKVQKMRRKLISTNIDDGIIDDGDHYYPISTDSPETLNEIQDYLISELSRITDTDFGSLFKVVGSWGKKPPGTFHKDLDLATELDNEIIGNLLKKLDHEPLFYKGLSTWTFVLKDASGIPRKIDIFKVEDLLFSTKAYEIMPHEKTKWPSWSRNMILNAITKVKINHDGWSGRFIPYKGLCIYNDKKESKIVTTRWNVMKTILGFNKINVTEDLINGIIATWSDRDKDDLMIIIYKDKKLRDLLESNGRTMREIENEIYKKH